MATPLPHRQQNAFQFKKVNYPLTHSPDQFYSLELINLIKRWFLSRYFVVKKRTKSLSIYSVVKNELTILIDGFDVVGGEDADVAVEVSAPPSLLVLGNQADDVADLKFQKHLQFKTNTSNDDRTWNLKYILNKFINNLEL